MIRTGIVIVCALMLASCGKPSEKDLLKAVRDGQGDKVASILDAAPELRSWKDDDGNTLLHVSTNATVTRALIERGADINALNINKVTPLGMMASGEFDTASARLIIEKGASPDSLNAYNMPLLLAAASAANTDFITMLLEKGASVRARKSDDDFNAVHILVSWSSDYPERLPEYLAALDALLKAGADINARADRALGITPLGIAAENGNPEMVKALLDRGADPKLADSRGRTPRDIAEAAGQEEVASLFRTLSALGQQGQ